jgi:hypothetical protein
LCRVLLDERGECADEAGIVVQRFDAIELEVELGGFLAALDVDVPQDLEVVGDEADGRDENLLCAVVVQALELLEEVGPEPGLPGGAGALEGERPPVDLGSVCDEAIGF